MIPFEEMKTPLYMIFAYFFLVIFGTIAGAFVFMIYQTCTTLVSGLPLSLFSLPLFEAGLFEAFPVCVILTALFVPLYVVRHPEANIVPTFAVYLVLSFLSWGLLLPVSASFSVKNKDAILSLNKKNHALPTTGYFRITDDSVEYLTAVKPVDANSDGVKCALADGISIAMKDGEREGNPEIFSEKDISASCGKTGDFADVIIKSTLEMPLFARLAISAMQAIKMQAVEAISGGVLAWICFASLGAALFSVFQLRALSAYKLADCIIVVLCSLGIIAVNVAYFEHPIFSAFRDSGSHWGAISDFVSEPPLVALNLAVFVVFTALGIINQMFFRVSPNQQNPEF